MTFLTPEILRLPEGELGLLGEPMALWEATHPARLKLASSTTYSSACPRGYIGEWSLRGGRLHLDALGAPWEGADPPPPLAGKCPAAAGGLFAHWVHGAVRCVEGEVVDYVHAGFASTWEREHALMFDRGVLVARSVLERPGEEESPWIVRMDEILARFGIATHDPRRAPARGWPGCPEPDPAGCAACHARWVEDRLRALEDDAFTRNDASDAPQLRHRPGAIVTPIGIDEAEALGREVARGPGVPDVPFGHLHHGWLRLLDEFGPDETLVHVRLPMGTRLDDFRVRGGDLRAVCVEGGRADGGLNGRFRQFVYLDAA